MKGGCMSGIWLNSKISLIFYENIISELYTKNIKKFKQWNEKSLRKRIFINET